MSGDGEATEQVPPGRSVDFRSQVQLVRQRLAAEIPSRAELYTLLLAPLSLLHILPQGLPHDLFKYAAWDKLDVGDAPDRPKEKSQQHRWIAGLQSLLLEKVFADWRRELERDEVFSIMAQQWFCPISDDIEAGAVQIASLETLTAEMSKRNASASHVPSLASHSRTPLEDSFSFVLNIFVQSFDLTSMLAYIRQSPSAQQGLVWNDACRRLVSFPDRIANLYGGDTLANSTTAHAMHAKTVTQLEQTIAHGSSAQLAALLLTRLMRAGIFQENASVPHDLSPFAAILRGSVSQIRKGSFSAPYSAAWSEVLRELARADQEAFLKALVGFLDRACFRRLGLVDLLHHDESQRPGAEGAMFMNKSSLEKCELISTIVDLFTVYPKYEDEDDDDSTPLLSALCVDGTAARVSCWTPMMARTLVLTLQRHDAAYSLRDHALDKLVNTWAADVRMASWNQQVYLTLTILLIIGSLPKAHGATSSLATDAAFIRGVSAHLEHLSPSVRRLGMLMAEIVAEKSGKGLSFGKKIWDGRGEGREESRVLRTAMIVFAASGGDHSQRSSSQDMLEILGLSGQQSVSPNSQPTIRPNSAHRASRKPVTKRLPIPVKANKSLIQPMDGEEDSLAAAPTEEKGLSQLLSLSDGPKLNPLAQGNVSDSDVDSSSESDSSDDDAGELADEARGGPEEGKAFGSGIPNSKSKRRTPIYVGELAPLLRESERGAVRMGLRYAAPLVTRKAGWGGEVHDNAVNLALALIGLNNNYRIAKFEERRLAALTALTIASPERVAACLAEQYFVHQYSVAQRTAMLNAMAFAAKQLSTEEAARAAELTDAEHGLKVLAQDLAQLAITRARTEGEAKVPAIQREKAMLVDASHPTRTVAKQPDTAPGASHAPYLAYARSVFIFPLVNRFWAYLQDTREMRRGRYLGGSGSSIIDMPFLVGAFLDTLAVLCYFAQNETQFRRDVVPEVLELTLTISRPSLSGMARNTAGADEDNGTKSGGSRSTILGAAASLTLVLLDAVWQLDGGVTLATRHAELLIEVEQWAAAIFEAADRGADRSVGALERSARASAAILLRLGEMRERRIGM